MSFTKYVLRGYSLMFRALSFALLSSLVVTLMFSNPGTARAVSLKESTVIQDDTIKLGDIFHGLETNADKVLGPAPRPGHDMILNARTLMRIAIALDLPWRPVSSSEYVVLSRAGSVVDHDMITEQLKAHLPEKGLSGKYALAISSGLAEMVLPPEFPASVEVSNMNVRADRNWFEATLVAPSKENPAARLRVNGTLHKLIEVPVLSGALTKGSIIGARDIEMIEIRERNLNHDVFVNPQDLIGLTPRRVIIAGKPVKTDDVQAPMIVKRGDLVTMTFSSGSLSLTAQGKALENGAKGDLIRVVNASSSKTIQAEVTASKEVAVQTF